MKAVALLICASLAFCAAGCGAAAEQDGADSDQTDSTDQAIGGCRFGNTSSCAPKVHWWNYVCASDAAMFRTPHEIGRAAWDLCGSQCATPNPVYIYDTQYGRRAAHGTAIISAVAGQEFPSKEVSGYLNMATLCACPRNDPHSCSAY
jgi:hypothetical protein